MSLIWSAIGRIVQRVRPGAPGAQAALYAAARSYCSAYENEDYDPTTNGEYWLLRRVSAAQVRTVFDVGANRGAWGLEAAARLSTAEIHAFELVPGTYHMLAQATAREPRIRSNPFGLSDADRAAVVHAAEGNTELSSTLPVDVLAPTQRFAPIAAEVRRGDAYCAERGVDAIDLLKVDVEGAEWAVLDGFGAMLEGGRIGMVQFEFGNASLILARRPLREFWSRLEAAGYRVGKLLPGEVAFGRYDQRLEHQWSNIVAVHMSRPDLFTAICG